MEDIMDRIDYHGEVRPRTCGVLAAWQEGFFHAMAVAEGTVEVPRNPYSFSSQYDCHREFERGYNSGMEQVRICERKCLDGTKVLREGDQDG